VKFMRVSPVFLPRENYSLWNLCLVSHIFVPREKLFRREIYACVPYVSSP